VASPDGKRTRRTGSSMKWVSKEKIKRSLKKRRVIWASLTHAIARCVFLIRNQPARAPICEAAPTYPDTRRVRPPSNFRKEPSDSYSQLILLPSEMDRYGTAAFPERMSCCLAIRSLSVVRPQDGSHGSKCLSASGDVTYAVGSARPVQRIERHLEVSPTGPLRRRQRERGWLIVARRVEALRFPAILARTPLDGRIDLSLKSCDRRCARGCPDWRYYT
jgi:hypothetical protein